MKIELLPAGLLITGVLLLLTAVIAVVNLFFRNKPQWGVRRFRLFMTIQVILILLGCASLGTLDRCGTFIAGQGDGLSSAQEWVARWRPNAEVECQARDTDDNGYLTCTVGWENSEGEREVEALECGINRWYQGWKTEGCRLMKGYSGSQK